MGKFVSRLAVVIASAIVSMAFVTVAAPGVSSADCDQGQWWDPVGNVCRPLAPLGCQFGQWWDPMANVCRQAAPTPLACDNGWWWDPGANACQPPLIQNS
jgi:hypothetical protein